MEQQKFVERVRAAAAHNTEWEGSRIKERDREINRKLKRERQRDREPYLEAEQQRTEGGAAAGA